MGAVSIEVCDNGSGIDPSNYANIALKHHTSKLCDFTDLNSVSSFGFRGEALNALCELSGKNCQFSLQFTDIELHSAVTSFKHGIYHSLPRTIEFTCYFEYLSP